MRVNLDLTDFDTDGFEQNPIVLWNFDHTQPAVGRAKIAYDKRSVEIELNPDHPLYSSLQIMPNHIAPAYVPEGKHLICLSFTPSKSKKFPTLYEELRWLLGEWGVQINDGQSYPSDTFWEDIKIAIAHHDEMENHR